MPDICGNASVSICYLWLPVTLKQRSGWNFLCSASVLHLHSSTWRYRSGVLGFPKKLVQNRCNLVPHLLNCSAIILMHPSDWKRENIIPLSSQNVVLINWFFCEKDSLVTETVRNSWFYLQSIVWTRLINQEIWHVFHSQRYETRNWSLNECHVFMYL